MTISQLAIIGAGLIGGSIALAARASGGVRRVVALERDEPKQAVRPIVERVFDDWAVESAERDRLLARSDLTILCVPVRTIVEILPGVLDHAGGVVTDCGSTKRDVVAAVEGHRRGAQFVPGHPMAGHPLGGLDNARADLFTGRRWLICPEHASGEASGLVRDFVASLGAIPIAIDASSHDKAVATTSHVPQIIASALSVLAHDSDAMRAAGPGFASATRVAGGAEAMWRDIFATNHDAIGETLRRVAQRLDSLGRELESGNVDEALALLESARTLRDQS